MTDYVVLPLAVSFMCQVFKLLMNYKKNKRWDFQLLTSLGGMPSSHSASVSCLSTIVGLKNGFNSPLFGISFFFSLIVMYDAAGLRRSIGEQAKVLNKLIEEYSAIKKLREERLRELLGHTPFEVFVGALIGILVAILYFYLL